MFSSKLLKAIFKFSVPIIKSIIFIKAKTPLFTTATACKRALTGVGATIAAGSQLWKGIIPALEIPNINIVVSKIRISGYSPLIKRPPVVKFRLSVKM